MDERRLTGASIVLHSGEALLASAGVGHGEAAEALFAPASVPLLEHRLARLHGTDAALVTSGRSSALALVTSHLLEAGDNLVAADQIAGESFAYLDTTCPHFSYDARWVTRPWETERWAESIDERTQLLFVECPSEPNMFVPDLEALAALAADHCIPLVVDTSVATPALCRAADWGATLVISALAGPLTGQALAAGGAVMGAADRIAELRAAAARSPGCALHPVAASLALLGLETLYDRLRTMRENVATVRSFLLERRAERDVTFVDHPSLRKHPQHRLAKRLMRGFAGPLLSFGVRGGERAAGVFVAGLEMIAAGHAPRSGRTTIVHPYAMTHAELSVEQKVAAVIKPGMLTLWVGGEHGPDIVADLERGLAACAEP